MVITTVNTTGQPIRDVPFPAIAICGLGAIKEAMQNKLRLQVSK